MTTNGHTQPIDFCTLGMFIIDEIHPAPSSPDQKPHYNIPGGAGTYSALGARLFSPPPTSSRSVGWIVDAGPDFPPELRETILSWQTGVLLRPRDQPTTSAWNGYEANEHRAFRYLNEKKRLTAEDLTPALLSARSFHLICSPIRCISLVQRILDRRKAETAVTDAPIFIWEPVPDLCIPDELENTYEALNHVDIVSPNHEELASLFAYKQPETGEVDRGAVEGQCQDLLARCSESSRLNAVVVRAGKEGCFVARRKTKQWLPAYHQDSSNVLDPTGGGNGFLGGFAVGLVRNEGDVIEAARWGSVAASFCIEQIGLPMLNTIIASATCVDEVWNDESVSDRLSEYNTRI
ncbi:Ribokinase-like protein [Neohortaea acidophila]|uniref:Ribokinase-like protein n=1 Tax=Neohortaea acidophila TaxID=245834 RepID=A0A6A6PIK2_9PEZI|nr:Ribokinase-like protein [Neohortaea acidophila]KAF2479544.1 Ribokinase-like protein [Neohortaea acidophila]